MQGLGISLKHTKDKNKDVEHDILVLLPTETSIEVIFIQVKTFVPKLWRTYTQDGHKYNEQLIHALKQTTKDIDTFCDVTSILIKDNLQKVSVKFFAVLHNMDRPSDNLSDACDNIFIDKNDLFNKVNIAKKMKIDVKSSVLNAEITAMYKMLVGI